MPNVGKSPLDTNPRATTARNIAYPIIQQIIRWNALSISRETIYFK